MVVIFVEHQSEPVFGLRQPTKSHNHSHSHNNAERSLLAERYKTKMCRNVLNTGACPYDHRCMFAHGAHELRTTDMNVRDGLFTEEAIKSFQRAMTAYNRGEIVQQPSPNAVQQAMPAPARQEVVHQPCQCDDCAAQYAHNPYYSAMPVQHPAQSW